jgi:hypothetical protein
MYFTGNIKLDPAQMTIIKRVKPERFLAKFLDTVSFGSLTESVEQETFTAVSIMQQFVSSFGSIGIRNVIRLAVDDYDFYLDENGVDNDLDVAYKQMTSRIDPLESELFNTVYLVMEHNDDLFKYLIEVQVNRKHDLGEYPIKIIINGVIAEFRLNKGESAEDLSKRIASVIQSENNYFEWLDKYEARFNDFMRSVIASVENYIKLDHFLMNTLRHSIVNNLNVSYTSHIPHERYSNPAYFGYFGFDEYFLYCWLWSKISADLGINDVDATPVDETGKEIE